MRVRVSARARARVSVSVSVRDPEGAREMGIGHLISCGHVLPHPDLTHVQKRVQL